MILIIMLCCVAATKLQIKATELTSTITLYLLTWQNIEQHRPIISLGIYLF